MRKDLTLVAALFAASLVATPLVMSGTKALATSEEATAVALPVATMPVEGNTQPYGLLHGGASVVLAETLGSVGSALHAHPDRAAVGVDINATHHRSATSGTVTGVATPVHLGRSSTSFEVVITNEAGKRVCTARITCSLIPVDRVPSAG